MQLEFWFILLQRWGKVLPFSVNRHTAAGICWFGYEVGCGLPHFGLFGPILALPIAVCSSPVVSGPLVFSILLFFFYHDIYHQTVLVCWCIMDPYCTTHGSLWAWYPKWENLRWEIISKQYPYCKNIHRSQHHIQVVVLVFISWYHLCSLIILTLSFSHVCVCV